MIQQKVILTKNLHGDSNTQRDCFVIIDTNNYRLITIQKGTPKLSMKPNTKVSKHAS